MARRSPDWAAGAAPRAKRENASQDRRPSPVFSLVTANGQIHEGWTADGTSVHLFQDSYTHPLTGKPAYYRDYVQIITIIQRHGRYGGLPDGVVTVRTLSGGKHYVFAAPEGEEIGNSRGSLPPGIDVRGKGGFIIAPGTRWRDGGWHEIEGSPKLMDAMRDGSLPPPPGWLIERLRSLRQVDTPLIQPCDRAWSA